MSAIELGIIFKVCIYSHHVIFIMGIVITHICATFDVTDCFHFPIYLMFECYMCHIVVHFSILLQNHS